MLIIIVSGSICIIVVSGGICIIVVSGISSIVEVLYSKLGGFSLIIIGSSTDSVIFKSIICSKKSSLTLGSPLSSTT